MGKGFRTTCCSGRDAASGRSPCSCSARRPGRRKRLRLLRKGGALHSPGNADWAADVNEARQRAAAQGKYVFIEFDRTGCGGCRRMDTLLYPAFDFEALLIPMVPVKVMIDTNEGRELAVRHGVAEVPAVLIESPEGRQVLYMQGFTNAPDFYAHVKSEMDVYRAFARKVEARTSPESPPAKPWIPARSSTGAATPPRRCPG